MESKLKQLGLKEYESKVYLALLKHGKLDAKQVSGYSGVPQNRVYETAEALQRFGFVDILLGAPKKFEARDPKLAINHYLALKEQDLQVLKKDANQLSNQLHKAESSHPEVGIWSVTGSREEIANRRLALWSSAKKSKKIVLATTRPPEKEFAYKKGMALLKQRGVDVRVIHNSVIASKEQAEWYEYIRKRGVSIRTSNIPLHMKMSIIDSDLAYLESTDGPEEQWYLVWTNSKPIVSFLENYFDMLWSSSKE